MTVEVGTTDINKIMLGTGQVNRMYVGSTLVFGNTEASGGGGGGGSFDSTAFNVSAAGAIDAFAQVQLNADGTASLTAIKTGAGATSTSPASPAWWTGGTPPAAWVSFSGTADGAIGGDIIGSGVRYSLATAKAMNFSFDFEVNTAIAGGTMTWTFHDAASGGNVLGTKTVTMYAGN